MDSQFKSISYDLIQNSAESNGILGRLVSGDIKILNLATCDSTLFADVRNEAMGLINFKTEQALAPGHPTFDYVQKWDPAWRPKENAIWQFSLYNSHDDMSFFDEDHHWFETRAFNSRLKYIPKFYRTYFQDSELQNFRMQAVAGGGDLGLHRERIVAIPKREHDYKLRFHLPVVTNPNVKFLMDRNEYVMKAGQVYLFNQACMHGVTNGGQDLRIHLVWDCYLNEHLMNELIRPALQSE